ncbi:MAG: AMP-binding protein [Nocardia sp.]|nr:AMP-binding protein [Nocardia sp.]
MSTPCIRHEPEINSSHLPGDSARPSTRPSGASGRGPSAERGGSSVPDFGIGSWPRRRARINPDAVALRQATRTSTYADLAFQVDVLARAMAARGVGRGDRIAYLGGNDIAAFTVFFASGRLGAVFVPLNTRLTGNEIAELIADAQPAALFHGLEYQRIVDEIAQRIATIV